MPPAPPTPPFGSPLDAPVAQPARLGGWEQDIAANRMTWSGSLRHMLEVDGAHPSSAEHMLDFCTPDSRTLLAAALAKAGRDGTGFELELAIVTAAGRNLRVRGFADVESHDGRPARIVGAFQDVTVMREREAARRRIELEMLAAEKAETLATFAGGVAHDFNNLLTGIMGYQELIGYELGDNTTAQEYIAQARGACLRARSLLEQILAFARQTTAAPQEPLDLNALVVAAQRQLCSLSPETVTVETHLAPDLPAVPANAAQIRLALLKLGLHLARPFGVGGGTLFLRVQRAAREGASSAAFAQLSPGDYLCLSIGDVRQLQGAAVERQLFERSFTTAEMRAGGGLDVAVVFRIVRAHHGALSLERDSNGGSEFRLYLPCVTTKVDPAPATPPPPVSDGGARIFIVDDEQTVASFMCHALQAKGYRVTTFPAPAACLDAFATNPAACDLLVTDHLMPGMTGFELVGHLRERSPRLPVLIMSGNQLELPAGLDPAEAGTEVLQKPFTNDDLRASIHRLLHPHPTRQGR